MIQSFPKIHEKQETISFYNRCVRQLNNKFAWSNRKDSTLSEHKNSPLFCEIPISWSLVFWLAFIGRCIVWPSSIYGFWLPLWYLQTLHIVYYRMYSTIVWLLSLLFWPLQLYRLSFFVLQLLLNSVNNIYWINCMSYNNCTYIEIRKQVTQHLYTFFSQIPKKKRKEKYM